jgi:hypothetical protein
MQSNLRSIHSTLHSFIGSESARSAEQALLDACELCCMEGCDDGRFRFRCGTDSVEQVHIIDTIKEWFRSCDSLRICDCNTRGGTETIHRREKSLDIFNATVVGGTSTDDLVMFSSDQIILLDKDTLQSILGNLMSSLKTSNTQMITHERKIPGGSSRPG